MNSIEHKEQSGSERLLSGMFEQQAAKHPDRTALLSNDWKLTFQQLEQRANRLAHFLQGKGIGPDQLVGLCLNRVSPENIVSVLAVLKAGGACLPLDPAYPQARLQYMLDDSNAALLLADKRHMDIFRELPCEVLDINDVANAALEESIEPLPPTATADNLFYVLYTSGSTGQPKGVAMHQRPLINLVNWQMDQSNLPPHSCTLPFSPFSFDLSFLETFTTLCSGGTLALINDDERLDPIRLTEFINRHQVARLFLPYVALHYLAEVADSENLLPSSVLEIISTAEQLKINPGIRKLFKALPGCVLINEYGPTETHVATAFQLEGDPDAWPALPSIGTAVSNTQIYILDEKLAPVPSGETGELYVGGAAVARGYLHRPELTDERFIPDPFSGGGRCPHVPHR
ncbi:MAG: AMP-binding protein [Kiritimatiellales bacterium]|nr:AMP-binding protein [Kiritimatiellales bacterium]